jgi:subtilisin family serine protease
MSDTAFRPVTRGSKPLGKSFLKRATRVALVTLATGAITLSLVAESLAQRTFGGRGFGMMNRPMGMNRPFGGSIALGSRHPGGMKMNAIGPRRPGGIRVTGDRTRFPGGNRHPGRHPDRPGHHHPGRPGILVIPSVPLGPGPGIVVVEDSSGPQRRVPKKNAQKKQNPQQPQSAQRAGFNPPPAGENRFVQNEVLLNISPAITLPALDQLARRHRLTRLELRDFTLPARRLARVRINDGRQVAAVIRSLQQEASILNAQPNYEYEVKQGASPTVADPMQYALGKLRLVEAHALARGESIRVAVIDTTIDTKHPVLAGVVAESFDATGAADKPHAHGTGIAGVIAAHGKLTGVAPSVKVLAINAFSSKVAKGTSMNILTGLERAGTSNADVVNMSFAGPPDPEMQLKITALRQKGAVLIAAAGNDGPNARPLYPAAYPEVIAVTATDADDKLFAQANRGTHIAVAAPGVAILAAAPEESYRLQSGTSFAAAQVSGVVALLLERNRRLDAPAIRQILMSTSRDLGTPGHDDQFGSGLVDAFAALEQAAPRASEVSGAAQSRTH